MMSIIRMLHLFCILGFSYIANLLYSILEYNRYTSLWVHIRHEDGKACNSGVISTKNKKELVLNKCII
jgi:hypothetical protein